MLDPPRHDTAHTIKNLVAAGIVVKVCHQKNSFYLFFHSVKVCFILHSNFFVFHLNSLIIISNKFLFYPFPEDDHRRPFEYCKGNCSFDRNGG